MMVYVLCPAQLPFSYYIGTSSHTHCLPPAACEEVAPVVITACWSIMFCCETILSARE